MLLRCENYGFASYWVSMCYEWDFLLFDEIGKMEQFFAF